MTTTDPIAAGGILLDRGVRLPNSQLLQEGARFKSMDLA
jgi:hypothetical protein